MAAQEMKVDLHVHSKMSDRPSQWVLQKLGCPESFTSPLAIYHLAKKQGMDLVTISDHNTVTGSLEIAHLEDTFISEEVTTYFPEDGCKIHVLAPDITEAQHEDIRRARKNVYTLLAYMHQEGILPILAHPLFDINHKLTLAHFEKMLLLFTHFEINGARDPYQNQILESILKNLRPADIERLADKHGIVPAGEQPWIKSLTGGSDDHSSLNIARMYTAVAGARGKEEFLQGLRQGSSRACGTPAAPVTMAHNLYGIAYQYYKSTLRLGRWVHSDALLGFADRALTNIPREDRSKGLLHRVQDFFAAKRSAASLFTGKSAAPEITGLIQKKGRAFLAGHARMQKKLADPDASGRDKETIWFRFVTEVSDSIIRNLGDTTLASLSRARLLNIFQTIGSAGSVYTLLAPYFMAYRLFSRDRRFAENCHTHITGRTPPCKTETSRVALFTDTYSETNGVALTLRMQLAAARKNGKALSIFTCYPDTPEGGPINFRPVGFYELPEYPEIKLYYPPFLKILDYCFRNRPSQIQASTPGPMGLCALAVARTLDIPVYGTYHTAFPQYAAELTGDNDIGQVMWKAMVWFYNQMNLVYVPSAATGRELVERGVDEAKIRVYPRGVDTERFHPERRNGIWSSGYGLSGKSMKLLYVGRLSREKNLDVLARAFRQLSGAGRDMDLIVVGDGPYKQEMAAMLEGTRTLFTGVLTGRRLAAAYASSDLFVFPSTTDTFGNVVLEAQASGLPVIVTDRGGPRENLIAGKTGCIVPSLDAAAIVREISRLSEDPAALSRMKKAARRYMRSRSFEENFLRSWELAQRAAQSTESPGLTEAAWPLAS